MFEYRIVIVAGYRAYDKKTQAVYTIILGNFLPTIYPLQQLSSKKNAESLYYYFKHFSGND